MKQLPQLCMCHRDPSKLSPLIIPEVLTIKTHTDDMIEKED